MFKLLFALYTIGFISLILMYLCTLRSGSNFSKLILSAKEHNVVVQMWRISALIWFAPIGYVLYLGLLNGELFAYCISSGLILILFAGIKHSLNISLAHSTTRRL